MKAVRGNFGNEYHSTAKDATKNVFHALSMAGTDETI
jgi:hypothetical protein